MDRLRILVLEDDPVRSRMLRSALRMFDVESCSSADEARFLLAQPWNAIVSNVRVASGSGMDLFDEAVGRRPELAARYVFVSETSCHAEVEARVERAAVLHFREPFDYEEFLEAIVTILVRQRCR
jgi:DNA-binding NtrC family response regulator